MLQGGLFTRDWLTQGITGTEPWRDLDDGAVAPLRAAISGLFTDLLKRKSPVWRVVQILLAVAVVAISFFYAIPKIASYSEVWTEIKGMTPLEVGFLLAATALNLVTYWWANMVSIPNLGLWQAAVNNQTSTTVANTMPTECPMNQMSGMSMA